MTNRKPKSTILSYSDDCEQIAYTGFTRFRLPLACRARSSMSMYLSVIALELCPALSRTCSLGQCSTSSEIPVCRSKCPVPPRAPPLRPESHRLQALLWPGQNSLGQSPESSWLKVSAQFSAPRLLQVGSGVWVSTQIEGGM